MLRVTFQTGVEDLRAGARKGTLLDDARALVNLRGELDLEEQRITESRLALARRYLDGREPERVAVPAGEFDSWFDEESTDGR